MRYEVFGEFAVPRRVARSGKKTLDLNPEALQEFWNNLDNDFSGLSSAKGCYVFAIRAGRGIKPWYVGQTKKSFKQECFTPVKQLHYLRALDQSKKGTPILLLVARSTGKGKISRGSIPKAEADFLEKMLIGMALGQNSRLLNKKDTKYLREIRVPGLVNSPPGPPSSAARSLKRTLGQR